MSEQRKTIRLRLAWCDAKVLHEGGVEFEMVGHTEGDKAHKIVLLMGPSTIGYMADALHQTVDKLQKELDEVKASLRGPQP